MVGTRANTTYTSARLPLTTKCLLPSRVNVELSSLCIATISMLEMSDPLGEESGFVWGRRSNVGTIFVVICRWHICDIGDIWMWYGEWAFHFVDKECSFNLNLYWYEWHIKIEYISMITKIYSLTIKLFMWLLIIHIRIWVIL